MWDKILIIRLDRIGDLVLSTPFIASVKKSFPYSHITLLVNNYSKDVLLNNPSVDNILVKKPSLIETIKMVRQFNFSLAIPLSPHTESYLLSWLSKAPERIGYYNKPQILTSLLARVVLTRYINYDYVPSWLDKNPCTVLHQVEQILALLPLIEAREKVEELQFFLMPEELEEAKLKLNSLGLSVPLGVQLSPYWFQEDKFSQEDFARLVNSLREVYPEVLLIYSKREEKYLNRVFPLLTSDVKLIGNLNIREWAGIIGKLKLLVTMDTGATHIAAALKKPLVCIFRSKHYVLCSQMWAPWKNSFISIKKPVILSEKEKNTFIEEVIAGVLQLQATCFL